MVRVVKYNGTKKKSRKSAFADGAVCGSHMEDGMTQDEKYMKEAIKQAKKAYALGEVPIGCVNRIPGQDHRQRV